MKTTMILALLVALAPSSALAQAQGVVPLSGGWSVHRRVMGGGTESIACSRDRAFARDWSGVVAQWDGSAWSTLPRRAESMYGRTIAASPDGHVFLGAGDAIAEWDGSRWIDHPLERWEGDVASAITAPRAHEVYYVGRGRVARFDGTALRTFGAGTWRDLSAIAIAGDRILIGGQGGTILVRDSSGFTRQETAITTWVRSLIAFAGDDVWGLADGETHRTSMILHSDGRSWTRREAGLTGTINAIGGSADHVYATGDAGLWRWNGTSWALEIAQGALGEDGNYSGLKGVCATQHHVVVGFGWNMLVRAR
jgi:hypothetical protein